jgi:hypothetical protein
VHMFCQLYKIAVEEEGLSVKASLSPWECRSLSVCLCGPHHVASAWRDAP